MENQVLRIRESARVALVTARNVDYAETDDRCLAQSLSRRGAEVEWVYWDDDAVEWPRFDRVVIRSTWDYHVRIDEFSAWLDERVADGASLSNSASLLRWNMNKEYLFELARRGVTIPCSVLLRRGNPPLPLRAIAENIGSERLVIKPSISASSRGTVLIDDPDAPASDRRLAALRDHNDVLVQQFVPEIQSAGEISLMFFGGAFSHAVRKMPAPGEFRSQASYGARVERVTPDASVLALAQSSLDALDEQPLYARVDVVPAASGPVLMELELIEPMLFLGHAPLSADVLASKILRRAVDHDAEARSAKAAHEGPRF